MSNQFYPFGQAPGQNPAQLFPYDVIINEENPGLVLEPTEANGVNVAFREVAGCSWWVLNADYNTDASQWEQVSPNNAALPAYALEMCSDGTVTRYVAAATNTPGTAVSWVAVWSLDAKGNVTMSPQTETSAPGYANHVEVTWNAGSPSIMALNRFDLTDTSSNASSYLEQYYVNGTPVWQLRKDGTLVSGSIPFSLITGFVLPNNPTFSGTATFNGPAVFNNTATFNDGLHVASGTATFDGPVVAHDGMTVTGGETVDDLHVSGTATIANLDVTGSATLPSGTIPITDITGSGGISVTNSGTTWNVGGSALVETVTSSDGTLTVDRTGQTVDLKAGATAPVVPGAWFVNTEFHNPGTGVTGGGVSLGPLPGDSSKTYRVVYRGVAALKDASSSITVTGTPAAGVTWDVSSATYYNGQANAFPFMYFGTAQGGTTPTVSWAAAAGEYIFQTPFFATIEAGVQL